MRDRAEFTLHGTGLTLPTFPIDLFPPTQLKESGKNGEGVLGRSRIYGLIASGLSLSPRPSLSMPGHMSDPWKVISGEGEEWSGRKPGAYYILLPTGEDT